jgi:hypothetical protein
MPQPSSANRTSTPGDVVASFDPGPHFPVRLANRRLHPLDPFRDDLVNGLALLVLLHLLLAQGLGDRRAASGL